MGLPVLVLARVAGVQRKGGDKHDDDDDEDKNEA